MSVGIVELLHSTESRPAAVVCHYNWVNQSVNIVMIRLCGASHHLYWPERVLAGILSHLTGTEANFYTHFCGHLCICPHWIYSSTATHLWASVEHSVSCRSSEPEPAGVLV